MVRARPGLESLEAAPLLRRGGARPGVEGLRPLDAARHQPHARHRRARLRAGAPEAYNKGTLAEGMVLTVEPGLYFQADDLIVPEEFRGIGVRIEDDVLVTADGSRNLSAALPRSSAEVEAVDGRQPRLTGARRLSRAGPAAAPSRRRRRKSRCDSSPIWTSATSVKPASSNSRTARTIGARSGPQGIDSATSSAGDELGGTLEARRARAARRSPSSRRRTSGTARGHGRCRRRGRCPSRPAAARSCASAACGDASSHICTSSTLGSTATRWSASGAKALTDCSSRDRDRDRDRAGSAGPTASPSRPGSAGRRSRRTRRRTARDDRQRLLEHRRAAR